MDEHIFFQTDNITVTDQRVVIYRKSYPLHDVQKAEMLIWQSEVPLTIPLILSGLGLLALFAVPFAENIMLCIFLIALAFGFYYIYDKLFTKTFIGIKHLKVVGSEVIYAFRYKKEKARESEIYMGNIMEAVNRAINYRKDILQVKIYK